jgi:flavin reductase (DIM6/NTAB) family NADH-FMN oxidoreductase RutF
VTSLSIDGHLNAAPFNFSTRLGQIRRSSGFARATATTDTARNVRATHEFVVNLVEEAVAEAMNKTSASLPYDRTNWKQSA